MKIFYKGFNFSEDGPGNRLVFHLQGCNLHCPWCSNPEGMPFDGGTEYTPKEILDECIGSRMMFFAGGGVTFTGGEATCQADELISALKLLREAGIHTALETNGTTPRLAEIEPLVDYLIMDVKHYDSDEYRRHTGGDFTLLKDNCERLFRTRRQLHIRIPLINGVNAGGAIGFAKLFSTLPTDGTVFELLPYHEYGKAKWKSEYRVSNGFVTKDQILEFKRIFDEYRLKLVIT